MREDPAGLSESGAQLPAAVLALDDDEQRRSFFDRHPRLATVALVERLCHQAAGQIAARPAAAARVVETAGWLAERLEDDRARGLALRAAANQRLYSRDFRGALGGYRASLARFEAAGDELGTAITLSVAVGSLNQLGEFELAEAWAERARRVFEARGDRLRLARLDCNVGQLYSRQDRFREALDRYLRAHRELLRCGEPRDVGGVLRNLAVCYQDLDDTEAALTTYREAAAYCREHGLHLLGLEVEHNIAYLHFMQGEYTRALREFEVARARSREHDDPHHAALADLDQAEIYLELNLLAEAEALAEEAAEGFSALEMSYEVAKAVTYQALAAARCGRRRQALDLLAEARGIFERQGNRTWCAVVDLDRAVILRSGGELDEAVRAGRAALDGFSERDVPTRTAACEVLLANLALDGGDARGALGLTASALERLEGTGKPALRFQALLVSGQAHESGGDRVAALASYREAERLLERLRGFVFTDELKISFSRDKEVLYQSLVRLTLQREEDPERLGAAFATIERAKSRALADLLAFRGSEDLEGDAEGMETVKSLRRELNLHYRELDREELAAGEEVARRRSRRGERTRRLERRLQRAVRRLRAASSARLPAEEGPTVDLPTARAALPPETCLLEYFAVGDTLLACLVGPESVRIAPVASLAAVERLLRRLTAELGKFLLPPRLRERLADVEGARTRKILGELYRELIAPLRADLDCSHLLLVPHGPLHSLPFHALWDGERYLIDELSFTYAPSATVYHLCRGAGEPAVESVVFGVADEQAPRIAEEARAVAGVLPASRLFLGREANRANLSRFGRRCRILHLATHGVFRGDNPMFSALKLGDGRLSLFDLYGLRLDAELVVLSGCGTGVSSMIGADELVGLTRGMLQAGARTLVASLWEVSDDSTTELMCAFYRELAGRQCAAGDLHRAQRQVRESYPHPFHWAPFVMLGRPAAAA